MNYPWLYPVSNLEQSESDGSGEFVGGPVSAQTLSSEGAGSGDAPGINLTSRSTGDQKGIFSSDLSAGGVFSPVCGRTMPIGNLSHTPEGGYLFPQEKRPVSERVGSPMDDMFGESLMVPFDAFSCL